MMGDETEHHEGAEVVDLFELLGAAAAKFDFDHYQTGESNILAPALRDLGYSDVAFYSVEADSFGPLIRGCRATDAYGETVRFWYG